MSLPQTKFRELVFLILFRYQFFSQEEEGEDDGFYMYALKTTKNQVLSAKAYVKELLKKSSEIDALIHEVCLGYELNRIQFVELSVLRLALYEMLFDDKVPAKVAISEGLRLAKKFSTKESVGFVNGILDQVYKNKSDSAYTAPL